MKYDTQIGELKPKLNEARSCLVALPANVTIDKLAAALALYLSLKQAGKSAAIVSEAELKVAQSNLFGIGDIKSELPEGSGGNLTLVMEGVVEGGKVPALEKLDWHPDGNNLNLIFHVLPGKKFEPINISPKYDKASYNLVFFIGASNLAEFGSLYSNNIEKIGDAYKVNIDNSQSNNLFGQVNIVDPNTISLSEVIAQVLQGLGLSQDGDIATNLIAGIYEATSNLTQNVSGDTFIVVGQEMQMGGKVPNVISQVNQGGFDIRQFAQPSAPAQPAESQTQQTNFSTDQSTDTSAPVAETQPETPVEPSQQQQTAPSQLETPTGEFASSPSPESASPSPDWLTPKIFKGGNLG